MKFDAMVLGGGIVGTSVALQLQRRGLKVALIDRKAPGNETSLGNAGLIQREGVYPYAFPRDFASLVHYAGNRATDVRYHPMAMPSLAPFLLKYWQNSRADRHAQIARAYSTLIEHSVSEHRELIEAAGAQPLLRKNGWVKAFRTGKAFEDAVAEASRWREEYGVEFEALDADALHQTEPSLSSVLRAAVRYTSSDSVSDPAGLVAAYAKLLERLGGTVLVGDASTLEGGWRVHTESGLAEAEATVIAMGPWSGDLTTRLGYSLPLEVKRGYHMHYASRPGATLNQPVLDAEIGYMITPMVRGIRLTTGVELGFRDSPKTPVQLDAVEPVAREVFPLGERVDAEPWLGRRPCTPDMMPVIGPAPRHKNIWFAFGHAHHGLTLGPITGRLIAESITGVRPAVDLAPFRAERF
ncbi:TPA: FAD-binding oxidoreductase [Burkholderia cenocepacia]|uniref:NAD(P)/FAD-dependent oxidoreductase n=1 Tax=unclassified Burkholderia TaxID=2613784 RepID=UPI00158A9884|nr:MULTISPECIES: FAD-binding oxidoreductase [unclassified Burkholderia]HEF5874610.1 FAD-binding oxidoreductase [Burkholderia cenocepacia]